MKLKRLLLLISSFSILNFAYAREPFLLSTKKNISLANIKLQKSEKSNPFALGLKFYPLAVTGKYFLKDNLAIEGLFYFWRYGTRITGLGEFHQKIEVLSGSEISTRLYAGGGAHLGFISNRYYKKWNDQYGRTPGAVYIGLDGVLGLDFRLSEIPLNVSIDWQPSVSFYGYDYLDFFEPGWGGISFRYMF
jgi:hypothetical protein